MKFNNLLVASLVIAAGAAGHYYSESTNSSAVTAPTSNAPSKELNKPANTSPNGSAKPVVGPAGEANNVEVTVNAGESIQAAVTAAKPGTTIRIMPGTYTETVYIDKDNIRLIGVIEQGKRATLDGLGKLNDAILYSGNNVVIENLRITRYKGNGIMGQAGNNFEIRNNIRAT